MDPAPGAMAGPGRTGDRRRHTPPGLLPTPGRTAPQAGRNRGPVEVALPLRRPDEPENRRGRRDRDQAREPLIVGGLVTGSARRGPSADRQRCRRRMAG